MKILVLFLKCKKFAFKMYLNIRELRLLGGLLGGDGLLGGLLGGDGLLGGLLNGLLRDDGLLGGVWGVVTDLVDTVLDLLAVIKALRWLENKTWKQKGKQN
jgi:hypothetical protein